MIAQTFLSAWWRQWYGGVKAGLGWERDCLFCV